MNIIPFLFALLIAFQLLFFSLQREVRHVGEELVYSRSAHFLERNIRSKEAHRELPKKKKVKKGEISSNKPKPTVVYKPLRESVKVDPHSQLNLTSFFQKNKTKEQETLTNLFGKMLMRLYGETLFSAYGDESMVCKKLLKEFKSKNFEGETNLTALYPKEEKLSQLFYTILKGTTTYTLPKTGVAPFGDFFRLSEDDKAKAICFPKASKELLHEMFGEKIAQLILDQETKKSLEKQKNSSLNLSELETLLNQEHFPSDQAQALFAIMDFAIPETSSLPEESYDEKVGLKKRGSQQKNKDEKH